MITTSLWLDWIMNSQPVIARTRTRVAVTSQTNNNGALSDVTVKARTSSNWVRVRFWAQKQADFDHSDTAPLDAKQKNVFLKLLYFKIIICLNIFLQWPDIASFCTTIHLDSKIYRRPFVNPTLHALRASHFHLAGMY